MNSVIECAAITPEFMMQRLRAHHIQDVKTDIVNFIDAPAARQPHVSQ